MLLEERKHVLVRKGADLVVGGCGGVPPTPMQEKGGKVCDETTYTTSCKYPCYSRQYLDGLSLQRLGSATIYSCLHVHV